MPLDKLHRWQRLAGCMIVFVQIVMVLTWALCFSSSTCIHECEILGRSGKYYPNPTFVVTAYDCPDEPLIAKSCTGCWSAVSH